MKSFVAVTLVAMASATPLLTEIASLPQGLQVQKGKLSGRRPLGVEPFDNPIFKQCDPLWGDDYMGSKVS